MTDPRDRPLDEHDLGPDPLAVFRRWFEEASDAGAFEPEAAALATATPDGRPSARMVLVKGVDERGFAFYTNYGSRSSSTGPRSAARFASRGRCSGFPATTASATLGAARARAG